MNNEIYIRRRSKLALSPGTGLTAINVLATLQKNLESLGFRLSENVLEVLKTFTPAQVESFYHRLAIE